MEYYVFDACSVIAFFEKEAGYEKVKELLEKADKGICTIYMNKINVLEVYYGFYREDGSAVAENFFSALNQLPVLINDTIDDQLFYEAGRFKSTYSISLADSLALAEASVKNAPLVTSDHHEFDVIDEAGEINFFWIR